MRIDQNKEMCCGCGACAEVCTKDAITMIQDREGFRYPKVNQLVCMDCGRCRQVCPLTNIKDKTCDNLYFGAQAKVDEIRYCSSSGGIFSVLAQHVIEKEGIVYGAGYDKNMNVIHKGVEGQSQLEQIRRTKYVQSNMKGIYSEIEKNLKDNRWVLFCGNPCQARALMLFLNKDYERLITVDLVCYGAPSPGVWIRYVKHLEHRHRGKMTEFLFRDKRNADNGHMISYKIDGREYVNFIHQDPYCKMYFRNYILRPSCYSCKYCTVNRSSDFTLGDFWGIEHIRSDMDDGMGTSMVIVRSNKAKKIWNEIKEETLWFECEKKDLLQPRLLKPVSRMEGRWTFWMLYRIVPFWIIIKLMKR